MDLALQRPICHKTHQAKPNKNKNMFFEKQVEKDI